MCGIVGYIGEREAAPLLLEGLEKLEYRGYDSSGIAVINENKLKVTKTKGRIKTLSGILEHGKKMPGNNGIGHTRWATHGKPSDLNSHPHLSNSGKFAVVHNGIIENYLNLRSFLSEQGKVFISETDTEVIAQLFEYYYDGNLLETALKVMKKLEGSFALGILCENHPDKIVAIKKDNPLLVGISEKGNFIASDITAIISSTRNIIRLKDNEIAILEKDKIEIFNKSGKLIKREIEKVNWDISVAEKCGFEHFMLKEIHEQPKALLNTISPRIKDEEIKLEINLDKKYLKSLKKIFIIGCGSAFHVGCLAKYIFEDLIKIPVEVDIASEFRYRDPIINEKTLVIAISQSGETADTLAAVREAKEKHSRVISIVNVLGSTIAKESDEVIYTWAGPEIAVATTKAYSTQLAVIYLLALYISNKLETINKKDYKKYINSLNLLPEKIELILKDTDFIKTFSQKFNKTKDIFFIGRNLDYALALEGSLKMKEISYIHSEAYAAGELKHGTISLIENKTLVIALSTQSALRDKMISNIKEVKARGATVLGISTKKKDSEIEKVCDFILEIPAICNIMRPSLAIIYLQLLSYHFASLRSCDIDKPRNLAKSVTVE